MAERNLHRLLEDLPEQLIADHFNVWLTLPKSRKPFEEYLLGQVQQLIKESKATILSNKLSAPARGTLIVATTYIQAVVAKAMLPRR